MLLILSCDVVESHPTPFALMGDFREGLLDFDRRFPRVSRGASLVSISNSTSGDGPGYFYLILFDFFFFLGYINYAW